MYKATDLVIKVDHLLLISIDEPTLSLRLVEAADRDGGVGCRPVCRNVNRTFRLMPVIIEVTYSFAADFLKTKFKLR